MKNLKLQILLLFASLFSLNSVMGQTLTMEANGKQLSLEPDKAAEIVSFTARYREGKTYLNWSVKKQACNGVYIILGSADGKQYHVLGQQKSTGVPVQVPIAYCFQDEDPQDGSMHYKVIHVADNKTYLLTPEVVVEVDKMKELASMNREH